MIKIDNVISRIFCYIFSDCSETNSKKGVNMFFLILQTQLRNYIFEKKLTIADVKLRNDNTELVSCNSNFVVISSLFN